MYALEMFVHTMYFFCSIYATNLKLIAVATEISPQKIQKGAYLTIRNYYGLTINSIKTFISRQFFNRNLLFSMDHVVQFSLTSSCETDENIRFFLVKLNVNHSAFGLSFQKLCTHFGMKVFFGFVKRQSNSTIKLIQFIHDFHFKFLK